MSGGGAHSGGAVGRLTGAVGGWGGERGGRRRMPGIDIMSHGDKELL